MSFRGDAARAGRGSAAETCETARAQSLGDRPYLESALAGPEEAERPAIWKRTFGRARTKRVHRRELAAATQRAQEGRTARTCRDRARRTRAATLLDLRDVRARRSIGGHPARARSGHPARTGCSGAARTKAAARCELKRALAAPGTNRTPPVESSKRAFGCRIRIQSPARAGRTTQLTHD